MTGEREVSADSDDPVQRKDSPQPSSGIPHAPLAPQLAGLGMGSGGIHAPLPWEGLSSLNASGWLPGAAPEPEDPAARARQEAARGESLASQGQLGLALEHFLQAASLAPDDLNVHYRLATVADKLGRQELVERHLLEALRIDPKHARVAHDLAFSYRQSGKLPRALEHARNAHEQHPRDPRIAALLGLLLVESGQTRQAWEVIQPLITAGATDRALVNLYARVAPAIGHEESALAALDRAVAVPNQPNTPDGKPLLHFAASALLDGLGRYDEAFTHARLGNELVRTVGRPHDPALHSKWVTDKIRYFSRQRLRALPRATHGSTRPVFIVGMPRSGTTLVEQILACHPAVHGAGELNALRLIAKDSSMAGWSEGAPYPQCLDGLSLAQANRLARQYLSTIATTAGPDAAFVTDKQPLNFLLLDLVELLFPGCHVIHCVRNAVDTCLSNYTTNFELSNEFKFDLRHLGAYYRDYRRLMEHWKKVLTVPMLEIRYEDLILDTESQVHRLLDFLQLPWDDRCLKPHENTRRAATASEDQVKRPIYTSSINRWKHYEPHLAPLIAALGGS